MNIIIWLFQNILYLTATSSVLILIILALKKIFHKSLRPKWHYYIWVLLLIRLIIPFQPQSSFSIYNVFYSATARVSLPIAESIGRLQPDLPGGTGRNTSQDNLHAPDLPNSDGAPSTDDPVPSAAEDGSEDNRTHINPLIRAGAYLWLAGMIVFTMYILIINIAFAMNVRRRYIRMEDERILDILTDCKAVLGICNSVPVLTAAPLSSLSGFFPNRALSLSLRVCQKTSPVIKGEFL